jgi:hypothetical protein
MKEGLLALIPVAPSFVSKIMGEYIHAYSTGKIDSIAPLDAQKLRSVISSEISVERELLEAYISLAQNQKDLVRAFFKVLS